MEDSWIINEGGIEYGPYTWSYIVDQVHQKKFSSHAYIRNEMYSEWVPLVNYFPPGKVFSPDELGIIPSRWDLVFYLGLGLFIVGMFAFFMEMIIGAVCLGLSPGIEVYAIIKDRGSKVQSVASKIGNICAVSWIVFQVAVTIFIVMLTH